MGAGEGPLTVTKGHCAGDSTGLFLPLGHRPPAGLRGRNLSSDSCEWTLLRFHGFPASDSLVRNTARPLPFFFKSLPFPSQGAAQTPISLVNAEPSASALHSPECFHSTPERESQRGWVLSRLQRSSLLAGSPVRV